MSNHISEATEHRETQRNYDNENQPHHQALKPPGWKKTSPLKGLEIAPLVRWVSGSQTALTSGGKTRTNFLVRGVLFVVMIALLVGCGGQAATTAPSNTITVSGAFALYPLVVRWGDEYKKAHPEVQFDVSAGGAGKGMSDVLSGAADIGMVSREVSATETDQGATPIAVAKDAAVAVANANNPVITALLARGLKPEDVAAIWVSQSVTTWGGLVGTSEPAPIHVFTRADSAGAADVWAKFGGASGQNDLKGTGVQGDPGVAQAVQQDPLGIGYNNIGFAYDANSGQPINGLRIIPLDLNGDGQISTDENFYDTRDHLLAAILDGRYPSPPARQLYLVTKGNPTGAAAAFIRWALTDGQAFVQESGYVALPADTLQSQLSHVGTGG
jgi:phosphate transport system substrate-binding protein